MKHNVKQLTDMHVSDSNMTAKEKLIINFIKNNEHKYPYGFFAEQVPELLGWDMSVRYPQRRYMLASYAFMQRLVKKGLVVRYYDRDIKKHLGYFLKPKTKTL